MNLHMFLSNRGESLAAWARSEAEARDWLVKFYPGIVLVAYQGIVASQHHPEPTR